MRISDWSSDVCSSDLIPFVVGAVELQLGVDLGIALDLVDVAVKDAAIAVAGIGKVEARDERHVAASQTRRILDDGAELVIRPLRQLVALEVPGHPRGRILDAGRVSSPPLCRCKT